MLPTDVREGLLDTVPARRDEERPTAQPVMADGLAARRAIEPLWMVEKRAIEAAIEACDGNINRAAGLLEVAPSTLYRKRQAWTETT
jgi:two-component system repressor protein LuxO